MGYELTDCEWAAIKPFLPNKPRGVPRANDRRVLKAFFWVLRSGAPWRDLPRTLALTPAATIALLTGAGLACGIRTQRPQRAAGLGGIRPTRWGAYPDPLLKYRGESKLPTTDRSSLDPC